jgi:LmbE family N-acetylglucosaminyl deacetylase
MISLDLAPGPLEVLCLAAHPDDVEIAVGGTLLELAARGNVSATWLTMTGTPERQDEARRAAEAFLPGARTIFAGLPDGRLPAHWGDVKQALEDAAQTTRPDLILAPRPDDAHQDHSLVGQLVGTAFRNALVLHYEIPKWESDLRPVTHYVPVDAERARRKVALLHEVFVSQHGRDWWDEETFLGVMRLRGVECRARYAEGFTAAKTVLGVGTVSA